MSGWIAYMDTEHFEFHAFGTSDLHAREQITAGFARHLEARKRDADDSETFGFWNVDGTQPPSVEQLHDYYGIRTIHTGTAQAWCDGEPV